MKRKLKDGSEVEQLSEPVALIIWTTAPEKWQITDLETGETYIGNKERHSKFGYMLLEFVNTGRIGQWKKI